MKTKLIGWYNSMSTDTKAMIWFIIITLPVILVIGVLSA